MYSQAEKQLAAVMQQGKALLTGGKTGLEKECLRMAVGGGIAQTPHPQSLGSALTNPCITTDYSEALLEFITPPLEGPQAAISFLQDITHFVYSRLDEELLWTASMPCVLAGESSIPIARYGDSNIGTMKTVYRRGLGHRYGRMMQVIAGGHYNYSFPDSFWTIWQSIKGDSQPTQDFISASYFHLVRNLQRHGWLIPFLFGSSPAVCKSFMDGHAIKLSEFNENTCYEPYATSLRMCDIGYQNSREEESGFKANYDSLQLYTDSLLQTIKTPCKEHEKIGVKVDGEYRQLSANILQIENEYYSSVRPKQVPDENEMPALALQRRGVRYVELRSLDINMHNPLGISLEQCRFLETFMAFCLFHESPLINQDERREIDRNLNDAAYRGREPGLKLHNQGKPVLLTEWATAICSSMQGFAECLDQTESETPYQAALSTQAEIVRHPDMTPSARILEEMRERDEGFFHYSKRVSEQHRAYFAQLPIPGNRFDELDREARDSIAKQAAIEAADQVSFDKFLEDYFAQAG